MVRNAVSNINPVREDRAARVLVLVLNQQSATISLHFTRLAIAPGQRYDKKGSNAFILFAVDFQLWFFDLQHFLMSIIERTFTDNYCCSAGYLFVLGYFRRQSAQLEIRRKRESQKASTRLFSDNRESTQSVHFKKNLHK